MAWVQSGEEELISIIYPEFDSEASIETMSIAPCCVPNLANPNPNTANFDNSTVTNSKDGVHLVRSVSDFYSAAAAGVTRPNAPPIFQSYQQMMSWKQAQNRR